MPKSILDDVDDIIDRAFGLKRIGEKRIGRAPHYRHRESYLKLSREPVNDLDAKALLNDIYEKVKSNWGHDREPSKENWRFEKQTGISRKNKSPEVKLERAIVNIPEEIWPDANNWVNQVSTASGLMNGSSDKHRDIDLVHQCENDSYEFIELKVKVESGAPLYAAMEILQYGVLYIFARGNKQIRDAVKDERLLKAKVIHLKVLAPCDYYKGCKLDWLEKEINGGLKKFLAERMPDLQMDFKFDSFLQNDVIAQAFRDCRRPVYPWGHGHVVPLPSCVTFTIFLACLSGL